MAARDISPMLSKLRALLLGRNHMNNLRFADKLATRSPEAPALPEGPSHKLYGNYYFTRDARREVKPPTDLASDNLALASGDSVPATAVKKSRTPGKQCKYSEFSAASPF
eukprot:TRINITY_DN29041_c0_g1_i1.p1 TRINITY_DN29041_c0_g1~~TRINITY_DN29041_c0_g1_i1.p1  ORF type:complete len:122 (-),score=21.89 TRINITY_DN29041_c0_g1_i1:278-607(-)